MSKQILVIHGGEVFETHEEYIEFLKNCEIPSLEKLRSQSWKKTLQNKLGPEYLVVSPEMPNPLNARYAEWKIWFEKIIPVLDDTVVLIGHSLGGIFLAKYLSENALPAGKKIKATFLVAAPFNSDNQHPLVDFVLQKDLSQFAKHGGQIFLYQSKDDMVVPYSNVLSFVEALPGAKLRSFDDRGHFNAAELPELVEDLKSLN